MREVPSELMELLPNGQPRVSSYDEFLRITGEPDCGDTFVIWSQAAYTLLKAPEGAS